MSERGAEKAEKFLKKNGFDEEFARRVADCVRTHRFRKGDAPQSIEAKILYDAARSTFAALRASPARCSIRAAPTARSTPPARTALWQTAWGRRGETFFGEYKRKLEGIYSRLFTARARAIARERQAAAQAFYKSMLAEVYASREKGERAFACLPDRRRFAAGCINFTGEIYNEKALDAVRKHALILNYNLRPIACPERHKESGTWKSPSFTLPIFAAP